MQIESTSIAELVSDPSNARKHSPKNLDAIKGSLAKFGQQKPIVVDKNNVVIAGNGTLEAAKALGWNDINIVRTDLTGSAAIAFAVADNRTGELAEWDDDVLSKTLAGLRDEIDLGAIGFDDEDLARWLKEPEKVPGCDEDEVPEQVEAKTKAGDLWQLGAHRLLCGDSTNVQHVEKLMGGEKADMVFTDPPYGIDAISSSGVLSKRYKQYANEENDSCALDFINMSLGRGEKIICFGGNYFAHALPKSTHWIIWDKRGADMEGGNKNGDQSDCEIAWTNLPKKNVKIYKHVWVGWLRAGNKKDELDTKAHPSQKPVGLFEKIFADYDFKSCFDGFLGSGSTLIACEKTNRKCFGMEIDPHYCDVIVARWEKFTGKKAKLDLAKEQ